MPQFLAQSAILRGNLGKNGETAEAQWILRVKFYVETTSVDRIVVPFHTGTVAVKLPPIPMSFSFPEFKMEPRRKWQFSESQYINDPSDVLSRTISTTPDEVIIAGPGMIFLKAKATSPHIDVSESGRALITISLLPVNAEHPITIVIETDHHEENQLGHHKWALHEDDI